MSYIVIHAVWLGFGGCHRNPCGSGVVQQGATTIESVVKLRHSPRRNDLDFRVDGKERQF